MAGHTKLGLWVKRDPKWINYYHYIANTFSERIPQVSGIPLPYAGIEQYLFFIVKLIISLLLRIVELACYVISWYVFRNSELKCTH